MKQATPEQIVAFMMREQMIDIVKRLETTEMGSVILCREAASCIEQLRAGLAAAADQLDENGLPVEARAARRLLPP